MKTIYVDKIGSVTKNIPLKHEVEITTNIPSEEGTIIVAEVLENKKEYNQLELPTGRLSILKKGDIIVVALGNRRALKGFVGKIPETLKENDTIHVLNIGGVAGLCMSENLNTVGHALPIKVLGAISKNNKALNIKQGKLFGLSDELVAKTPLIVVSGTCMNVGKTSVACEIISHASRYGFKIYSTKLAGVACLRDTEKMKDYGAKKAVSFLDAGLTSTVEQNGKSVQVTKGALNYLSKDNPDFIIIEFGDGIFGEYGVMDILKDKEISKNVVAHVGCAHDPMGASKLFETCNEIDTPIHVISGPVTDNSVGKDFIKKELQIPAFNALYYNNELFNHLLKTCLKK
jgi:hypothetical protein